MLHLNTIFLNLCEWVYTTDEYLGFPQLLYLFGEKSVENLYLEKGKINMY